MLPFIDPVALSRGQEMKWNTAVYRWGFRCNYEGLEWGPLMTRVINGEEEAKVERRYNKRCEN